MAWPDFAVGGIGGAPPLHRNPLDHDLDEVRQTIGGLLATVSEDVLRATDIVLSEDLEKAERMIGADDEVHAVCVAVEKRCYRLLALHAPVASDLRELVAALRILAEVERSADLAVNLCKTAPRLHGASLPPRIRGFIRHIAAQAAELFHEAGEAYVLKDASRAAALSGRDDSLDDLHRQFVAAIVDTPDGVDLATAIQLAKLARFYERLGDRAVVIGERTTYLVTGTLSTCHR